MRIFTEQLSYNKNVTIAFVHLKKMKIAPSQFQKIM